MKDKIEMIIVGKFKKNSNGGVSLNLTKEASKLIDLNNDYKIVVEGPFCRTKKVINKNNGMSVMSFSNSKIVTE